MKVSVRRNGIVLRVVDIHGDSARIGNSPDSDIVVDDPYLSPHVADFVSRNGEWRVVDGGRLEGIRTAGRRIDDEPLVSGTIYSVGGFELIPILGNAPASARPDSDSMGTDLPGTVIAPRAGASLPPAGDFVPQTIMESAPPIMGSAPTRVPFATGFESVAAPPAEASPPRASRRRTLLAASGALGVAIVSMLIFALLRKPETKAAPISGPVAETAAPVSAPDPANEIRAGERALAALDYDRGLEHWEKALKISPDPQLQRRYADVAVDIGRGLLARGEASKGAAYLKKAIAHGPAGSESVMIANRMLQGTALTP